jgi:hypothetical protein
MVEGLDHPLDIQKVEDDMGVTREDLDFRLDRDIIARQEVVIRGFRSDVNAYYIDKAVEAVSNQAPQSEEELLHTTNVEFEGLVDKVTA